MQIFAFALVICTAIVIAGMGLFALIKPRSARAKIGLFATSHRINLIEQAWRGLAGLGLILQAPASRTPAVFEWLGWLLIVTAAALLVIPLHWHGSYARWWSQNMPLWLITLAGVLALLIASWMIWSAVG